MVRPFEQDVSHPVRLRVGGGGETSAVPDVLRDLLPGAPTRYQEHDELTAGGVDVPWRYAEGVLHAATAEGLAHGLAWARVAPQPSAKAGWSGQARARRSASSRR